MPPGILAKEGNARIFQSIWNPTDANKLDGKEVVDKASAPQLADLAAVYGAQAECDGECVFVCAAFKANSSGQLAKVEGAQFANLPFDCVKDKELLPDQLAFVGPALRNADTDLKWILENEAIIKNLTEYQFAFFLHGNKDVKYERCGDLELDSLLKIASKNTGGALKAIDDFTECVLKVKDIAEFSRRSDEQRKSLSAPSVNGHLRKSHHLCPTTPIPRFQPSS